MSRQKIPDKYLNTIVNIYRQTTTKDVIGEFDVEEALQYASVPALVLPERSELEFNIQGKVFFQTDACYINRYDPTLRTPLAGDYTLDLETDKKYLILGVENQQSMRKSITDSCHIKLRMRYVSGVKAIGLETLTAKGKIQ